MARELPPQIPVFVAEYLKDFDGCAAWLRATGKEGDGNKKTATSLASRWLGDERVQKLLRDGIQERMERANIQADKVLVELARIGFSDIGQLFAEDGTFLPLAKMPESARRCIASIEVEELFAGKGEERQQIGFTRKVKLWDKPAALTTLARHLGLLNDKLKIEVGKSLAELVAEAQKGS